MTQLELKRPLTPWVSPIERAFQEFHAANPQVYSTLLRLAREAVSRGKRKLGMKMLWEVARWQIYLETVGDDFKLNNNFTSRYARMMMTCEPDLKDVFNLRELKA